MKFKYTLLSTLLTITSLSLLGTGCKSAPQADGSSHYSYDPVTASQVEQALEPIAAGAIRRVLKNSPQHSDEIATYIRAVGSVFCQMDANHDFSPLYLVTEADKILAPKLNDDYVIDIKNAVIALYKIQYGDRFRAALPADQWPSEVAKLFCHSIDAGLKDSGKQGVN